MRKILLITLILTLNASLAAAQGRIGLFADAGGTACDVVDTGAGLLPIFVVHINSPGSTAAEYAAVVPPCYGGQYLSDTTVFPVNIGSTQTEVSTAYGGCLSGNIHIMTINLLLSNSTPPCCVYPVTPGPVNGLNITDCGTPFPTKVPGVGQSGIVNPVTPGCECADIVATHTSTWGGVKALWSTENQ